MATRTPAAQMDSLAASAAPPAAPLAGPPDPPNAAAGVSADAVDGAEAAAGGCEWVAAARRAVMAAIVGRRTAERRPRPARNGSGGGGGCISAVALPAWLRSAGRGVVAVSRGLDAAVDACVPAPEALPPWLVTAGGYVGAGVTATAAALTFASPLLSIGAGVWAILDPAPFAAAITPKTVHVLLSLVMLSMGLTLTLEDVWGALRRPWLVALSLSLEYGLAPLSAFALGHLFRLPPAVRVGLTLVGSVNGGQASNFCTYLARGDTATSVLMTLSSSLLAIVAIPALSKVYLSGLVTVDAGGLARSTATLILAPVAAGVVVKALAGRAVAAAEPAFPIFVVAALVVITLGATGGAAEVIQAHWALLLAPIALFHGVGFGVGYGLARRLHTGHRTAVALAFEAGLKSPVLSWVLARRHFDDPAVQAASSVSILVLAPMALGAAVAFRWWYVGTAVGARRGGRRGASGECGCIFLLIQLSCCPGRVTDSLWL